MSDLEPIEIGSRHDLRAARSPDAPDTNGYEGRGATFGWVHSYETGSTVDGPGVRITLFMSGCLLRCQYCHNPDTWHLKDGTKVELAQAVRRLADFAPMLRAMGGGLTISGGEPLVQIGFTGGMLAAAKRMGLHTAIETSGFLGARADDAYLANLDMVILDIKSGDPETYRKLTGKDLAPTLRFAERLNAMGKPVWVRFVLAPGLTDAARQHRSGGALRRADEERRTGRSAALPPDGRLQVEIARPRLSARRHGAAERDAGENGPRYLPPGRLQGALTMAVLADFLASQPILSLFLAVSLGYAVGQINIFGFSLGIGAVLFVGLAIGAIAPKAQITGPIGLIGLTMFLYGIGILYGRQFFEGLSGPGRIYNLLAFVAVIAALVVSLALGRLIGVGTGEILGVFAGSMTSTPTLQAALDLIGNKSPSIGYSVSYPFGVIGPILCFYFMTRAVKPIFPPAPTRFHMAEITIEQLPAGVVTLADVMKLLPAGVQISSVRRDHHNQLPDESIMLRIGDGLLVVAERQEAIGEVVAVLGRIEPGRLGKDRSDLSYQRFFVSKQGLTGVPLADLPMPDGIPLHILHLRRYDVDIVPSPDLMLEIGDRVGLLVPPEHIQTARAFFGDTVKATAEFSYISVGLGMVLGVLLGLVPIPLPGVGTVTLGIGGGPLIVALIVGRLRRTGPISWVMPLPANIVLRNFGLTLFLATVGINSGQAFLTTVAQTGPVLLLIGAVVVLTTILIILLVGHFLLRIPYDDLLGVASGATGNPAILVYANRMAPTEQTNISYAMIFPSATIVKVVGAQIAGLALLG